MYLVCTRLYSYGKANDGVVKRHCGRSLPRTRRCVYHLLLRTSSSLAKSTPLQNVYATKNKDTVCPVRSRPGLCTRKATVVSVPFPLCTYICRVLKA